jgi:hypothetical protein
MRRRDAGKTMPRPASSSQLWDPHEDGAPQTSDMSDVQRRSLQGATSVTLPVRDHGATAAGPPQGATAAGPPQTSPGPPQGTASGKPSAFKLDNRP